ncbi:Uncharacterised protein [Dermatophilus congolensis]|uniref:Uncharacterized protein n=1 Tax=Dermatophilus congolensis TaxID=1863 RepID=A0AA46GZI0_9MICO|nr:Uncharacterised protein [Dermatophilus congolensis]
MSESLEANGCKSLGIYRDAERLAGAYRRARQAALLLFAVVRDMRVNLDGLLQESDEAQGLGASMPTM